MESTKKEKMHPVVDKIRKIINDKGLTRAAVAEYAGTSPSQFSKIMSGEVQLSLWQLSNIARHMDMDIIDIFTYPDKYISMNEISDEITASLTIQLKREKKEQVLRLIFGDQNLELLNK